MLENQMVIETIGNGLSYRDRRMDIRMRWKVSEWRKDKRTGALDPVPMDRYTKYAFDELHHQFHGESNSRCVKQSS